MRHKSVVKFTYVFPIIYPLILHICIICIILKENFFYRYSVCFVSKDEEPA